MARISQPHCGTHKFRLTPLFTALLLVYPAMQARYALAEPTPANTPQHNTLPELGRPSDSPATLTPKSNGVTLDNRSDGKRLVVSPEYSDQTGLSIGGIFAFPLGDSAASGLLLTAGNRKKELLFNAGFQLGDAQRLILTLGQQRQHLDISFLSGTEKTALTQNNGAASYQFRMGQGLLDSAEINGYLADTPSRNLADKTYAVDTAALYELWNDPRRVAGGRVTGLQGRLAFTPLPGGTFKLGAGGERQEYDYLTGKQSTTRATGSAEWSQQLAGGYRIKAGADAAVQNRYSLGIERSTDGGGLFGASFTGIRGKNGAPNDNQLKLTWRYDLDGKRAAQSYRSPDEAQRNPGEPSAAWGSLLDQVAQRPGFLPAQVVAKLDTTAAATRLIAVDKTALPAGSSVNTATGAITTPLGIVATGIAGVTLNAAPFANTGQFALSGNSLVIDPSQIIQPAVGVIDTYVVTVNISGGGTSLVTVVVSHGSVKIDSITIANGDATAPTTTVAPAVSATSDIATTLSVTINEAGTGYYLVQAAAAVAPTVAAVQAGTSFAMTANVAATPAISGLAASTAYTVYFVAKDAANNVQAAVQSINVTTTATPDTTAPVTNSAPAISVAATDTAASVTQTINENGTGYYLVQAAAAAAPSVAAVMAGTSFAMTAGTPAVVSLTGLTQSTAYTYYFVAKDSANNVQAAVSAGLAITTAATADTTAPTTSAGPSVSGTTDTATTLSATINENGTGYYLVQAFAAAAPNVAAVQAGTSFAMTAGVAATPAIGGLTAATAYKIYFVAKDAANNVQAAVGSVAVTTAADATSPNQPTLTATPQYTTANSVNVEVNGEVAASVWVGGVDTGSVIAGNGKVTIALNTAGVDGAKNFAITLKDALLNTSGTLNVSILKDVVAPSTPVWTTAQPTIRSTPYNASKITLTETGSGLNTGSIAIAGDSGGIIAGISVSGNVITFNYTTPNAAGETLTITGTDNAGNAINVTIDTAVLAPAADIIAPNNPTLTATPQYTTANPVNVEVNGEIAASVWVGGVDTGSVIAGNGKVTIALNTAGVDGTKNFAINLKDAALNASGVLNVSVLKDVAAPSTPIWSTTQPSLKSTAYNGSQTALTETGSGINTGSIAIAGDSGGIIGGISVSGNVITFNYTTPNAAGETLTITGTDNAGNAFSVTIVTAEGKEHMARIDELVIQYPEEKK